MRKVIPVTLLALAVAAGLVFWTGLDDRVARMAVGWQRDYQNALARVLRALRGGEAGAVTTFLGICFAYGFLHALGPGHGKALIGAYGVATDVPMKRMVSLAAITSLAQATVAVVLVYVGVWIFGGARDRVEGASASLEPFSAAAIALLGVILCWRGLRRLAAGRHRHGHAHSETCGCGHAHVPDAQEVLATRSWREAAALVAGVALRPCTGALFLLILTWRFGLDAVGIAGVYAMGIGTMMVTGLAAVVAVGLRRGVHVSLPAFGRAPVLASLVEIVLGGLVAIFAFSTALRLLQTPF
ncbi:high frequency lysogenization protein HflD (plasmid) [Paracoccus sp. MA]|uniref:nickel/cobalt transporter n=1 Tax=Paracoccus sp. MA TaxID=2895796 RepID=UPI001E4244B9|nr:high frequency lysogenization protein HflD [Paracoccus sp. MA]UFM67410.1 high frequency lysogenization protein HflD [Paracoccus sp. MA]